mmetsp:Transcript_6153/g.16737  ORF Transcript_6153/g.16737 Transcript_6153/m.16737 type:complete len:98 (-) Transcript_6153:959-1252(-)
MLLLGQRSNNTCPISRAPHPSVVEAQTPKLAEFVCDRARGGPTWISTDCLQHAMWPAHANLSCGLRQRIDSGDLFYGDAECGGRMAAGVEEEVSLAR